MVCPIMICPNQNRIRGPQCGSWPGARAPFIFLSFYKSLPMDFFFVGRFIVAFLVCLLRHKDINQLWPDHPPSAVCSAVGCLVIIWRTDTICSQILFSRSLCAPKVSAKIACSHLNPFLSSKHSHTHQADSTVGPQFTIHHYLLFLGHRY